MHRACARACALNSLVVRCSPTHHVLPCHEPVHLRRGVRLSQPQLAPCLGRGLRIVKKRCVKKKRCMLTDSLRTRFDQDMYDARELVLDHDERYGCTRPLPPPARARAR